MAAFEKDRAARRYYLQSKDVLGAIQPPGGIPTGSIATYTETGDKFIYDGNEWTPWAGETEDLLVEIRDTLNTIAMDGRITRKALAVIANEQSGTEFSTDDE